MRPFGQAHSFKYSKSNVDEIFQLLLLNKNSIAAAFEIYSQSRTPEHQAEDIVRLIEKCANAIRDGVKTSEEWWTKHCEEVDKLGHRFETIK